MRPIGPISPGSTWHSSACRWISASPTAPAPGFGPRAVREVERIGPYNHALEVTPRARMQRRRYRRRAVALALQPRANRSRTSPRSTHASGRRRAAGRRSAATIRSPTDPEIARAPSGRSASSISTPIATPGRDRRLEVPPWRPVPPGGAGRRARPRAHDPDRHPRPGRNLLGVFLRIRHDGAAHRGCRPARHRRRCRKGARGRRRRPDLHLVRRRRPRPGLCPRHRHPRGRRA